MRAYRSPGLGRSVTLLRVFVVASALILAVGAVTLSATLSSNLRSAALQDSARDAEIYVDAATGSSLTPQARRVLRGVAVSRRTCGA